MVKIKKIKIILLVMLMLFAMVSCNEATKMLDSDEIFIPEPANKFAIDKETEVETVESTGAHHVYPADFKIDPGLEVVIGEKQYLTKINYIYNNVDKFKDSTILVEGMYGLYTSWDETFKFPIVYRNGPSCHGDDQFGGFFLVNIDTNLFTVDDWIKVKGKPFMYEHTDSEGEIQKFLFLLVEEVKTLGVKERKAEMVNN